ncbi:MAG: hypothetical protein AABY22_00075 [Nanoarchaeota archaeon]
MAKCKSCKLEMLDESVKSCTQKKIGNYKRNTDCYDVNERCHDCNIVNKAGNIHHLDCDMERCPKCGDQLIGCGCKFLIDWSSLN